jgi:glyoxylase-like metal-dependent hydrolase (beta-lactamase superfamily II)
MLVHAHADEAILLREPSLNLSKALTRVSLSVVPDVLLNDGDDIAVGGLTLKVIHSPGHTVGGACYYDGVNEVLFTGDTLFFETEGRTDLPTSDEDELMRTLNRLFTLKGGTVVYPGHGQTTTVAHEKKRCSSY